LGFLKSIACVLLVCKAVDKIRIRIFFGSFGVNNVDLNELVVASFKLTNNFAGLFTSGLGPDMALGQPVVPR
jgi:hypothetical protein